jgi:hypothetical protein
MRDSLRLVTGIARMASAPNAPRGETFIGEPEIQEGESLVILDPNAIREGASEQARLKCSRCGWQLPRFDCPHQSCNGVGLPGEGK